MILLSNPPLRKEDHVVAESVSEGLNARSGEINGESSASRKTIFETSKSKEKKQITFRIAGSGVARFRVRQKRKSGSGSSGDLRSRAKGRNKGPYDH